MSLYRRVPIVKPINPIDVWEHTPLDIYRHGEYPRFLRPVGPRLGDHETKWQRVELSQTGGKE